MLFQIYGDRAGFQLLGWLLVFAGLILTNEIARRTKKGGIFFFLILPGALTVYFVSIYVGAAMGAQWALLMYSANNLGDATLFSQARSYAYPGGRELLEMTQRWVIDGYKGEYDVPTGFRLSDEESEELNTYSGDLSTYINENYAAFFAGEKPLSEWDSYIEGMYSMGMQNVLDLYQSAYDAYLASKE